MFIQMCIQTFTVILTLPFLTYAFFIETLYLFILFQMLVYIIVTKIYLSHVLIMFSNIPYLNYNFCFIQYSDGNSY